MRYNFHLSLTNTAKKRKIWELQLRHDQNLASHNFLDTGKRFKMQYMLFLKKIEVSGLYNSAPTKFIKSVIREKEYKFSLYCCKLEAWSDFSNNHTAALT